MDIKTHIQSNSALLNQTQVVGDASPTDEVEYLLAHILKKDRAWIYAHTDEQLTPRQVKKLEQLANRRLAGEPLAYIIGHQAFYGRNFTVNASVLIPRPETELIIDQLKAHYSQKQPLIITDVGTGSGCLAITAALEFPFSYVYAVDISPKALTVAKKNAKELQATNVDFFQSNLLEFLHEGVIKSHAIIANLPYLTATDLQTSPTPRELAHEPSLALIAENDGQALIIACIKQSMSVLKQGGHLFLEMKPEQIPLINSWVKTHHLPYTSKIIRDLSNNERILILQKA